MKAIGVGCYEDEIVVTFETVEYPFIDDKTISSARFKNLDLLPFEKIQKIAEILSKIEAPLIDGRESRWVGHLEPEMIPLVDIWLETEPILGERSFESVNLLVLIFKKKVKNQKFFKYVVKHRNSYFDRELGSFESLFPEKWDNETFETPFVNSAEDVELFTKVINHTLNPNEITWGEQLDMEPVYVSKINGFQLDNSITVFKLFNTLNGFQYEEMMKRTSIEMLRLAYDIKSPSKIVSEVSFIRTMEREKKTIDLDGVVLYEDEWRDEYRQIMIDARVKLLALEKFLPVKLSKFGLEMWYLWDAKPTKQVLIYLLAFYGKEAVDRFIDFIFNNQIRTTHENLHIYLDYCATGKYKLYDDVELGMIIEGYLVDGCMVLPYDEEEGV